jgi:hypothetical protein
LLSVFDARNDVSYVLVAYDPIMGIIMQCKRKQLKEAVQSVNHAPANQNAAALYDSSGMINGERLLLIFLFASDDEIRMMYMHPEAVGCDTTFGTENSKKQLLTNHDCLPHHDYCLS